MSEPSAPPPPPPPEPVRDTPCADAPSLADGTKKKSRLQWDEDNLNANAAEMERAGPRMKIDEPNTPYVFSETGSSTSGSAHQSPPESPFFLPGENLHGFGTLEDSMRPAPSSDGASSAGSAPRSVHIDDNAVSSGGSSPRSRELFAARRKAHYRNEARLGKAFVMAHALDNDNGNDNNLGDDDDVDDVGPGDTVAHDLVPNGSMNGHANGIVHQALGNGVEDDDAHHDTTTRLPHLNGHIEHRLQEADDPVRSTADAADDGD